MDDTSTASTSKSKDSRPRPRPADSNEDDAYIKPLDITFINKIPTEVLVHWGAMESDSKVPQNNRYSRSLTIFRPLLQHLSASAIQKALSSPCVAFFPGNPGAIEAYAPFLKYCYEACDRRISFIGVGYAGHSSISYTNKIYNLHDQIDHKRCFVDQFVKLFPENTPLFLMGHSIGAFIAAKLTATNTRINGCINLFPTLTDLNKTISPSIQLLASPLVHPAFHFLFHTVLAPFRKSIASKLATDTAGIDLIDDKKIHNPDFSENVLQLSRSEAQTVQQEMDADIKLILEDSKKMMFLFSDTDQYNLDHPKRYNIEGKKNVTICSMNHAFVVDDKDSKWVSDWVSRGLQSQFNLIKDLTLAEKSDPSKARRKRSRE